MFQFFTEDQEMLRKIAREFVEREVAPYAADWDEEDVCPAQLWPVIGSLGFFGIFVPEQYGGAGLGLTERTIVLEEVARYSPGLAIAMMTHDLAIAAIYNFGTEAQKNEYLKGLVSGEKVGGLSVTEPTGGSDLGNQGTTIEKDGDNWVVNGRKVFISNSHITQINVVTGTSGVNEKGRKIISAVIVPEGTPGIGPGRKENKLGLRGSVTGEVILNNVKVPLNCILGQEGKGTALAMHTIGNFGRSAMAAISVGIMRGCIEESIKFAKERIVYGNPISKLQAIQFIIAENEIEYEAAHSMLYNAVSIYDKGQVDLAKIAAAKFFASEAAIRASRRSIDLMGGYGVINDYPVGRFLRDALSVIPSGGTSQIMQIIVASSVLA